MKSEFLGEKIEEAVNQKVLGAPNAVWEEEAGQHIDPTHHVCVLLSDVAEQEMENQGGGHNQSLRAHKPDRQSCMPKNRARRRPLRL